MRVQASVAREGDDASAKRKLPESAQTTRASAGTTTSTNASKQRAERDDHSRYNYSGSGGRSKLQLQCSDGRVFDVTHEEAMMSSTLWMLLQDVADKKAKTMVKQHMIPIFDVPSNSVELALFYCRYAVVPSPSLVGIRTFVDGSGCVLVDWFCTDVVVSANLFELSCLYKQQVEGHETALHAWDESFLQLDSKTLCDLAKVASHLDIQPLVDLTCRSIAQIMSATEAAHEIRQKFGLEDSPAAMECSCELRNGMSGFDFDMFNSLDHDLSTEEYELVEFDQPSVDELVSFINGSGGSRPSSATKSGGIAGANGKNCHMHTSSASALAAAAEGQSENGDGGSGGSKKKKNKKKKKKKAATSSTSQPAQAQASSSSATSVRNQSQESLNRANNTKSNSNNNNSSSQNASNKRQSDKEEDDEDDEDEDNDSDADSSDESSTSKSNSSSSVEIPRDLQEKMRLARQNPSAIFLESQFEDEDEEMQEQIESFRLALESAHLESGDKAKPKPCVKFAPQDVFRSTLVASQRHTSQRVSAAI